MDFVFGYPGYGNRFATAAFVRAAVRRDAAGMRQAVTDGLQDVNDFTHTVRRGRSRWGHRHVTPDVFHQGSRALHGAASTASLSALAWLLLHGADVTAVDDSVRGVLPAPSGPLACMASRRVPPGLHHRPQLLRAAAPRGPPCALRRAGGLAERGRRQGVAARGGIPHRAARGHDAVRGGAARRPARGARAGGVPPARRPAVRRRGSH